MEKYRGYKEADAEKPYAKYYNENIQAVSPKIINALKQSPFTAGKLLPIEDAVYLRDNGYTEIENGYSIEADGSVHIAALTAMPMVTPEMWHWWFGWHGCMANRYKLWHPKAHVSAQWKDGNQNLEAYIGRTSMIEEYIGKKLEKAAIQFVKPTELGFTVEDIANKNEVVYICARLGLTTIPADFGWLIHQVRKTKDGSEMRSRFWLGGKNIQLRLNGTPSKLISTVLQKAVKIPKQQAIDLLTHCAEEMNHLATFLPQLYSDYHP